MRATFDEIIPRGDNVAESFVYTAPKDALTLGDIAIIVDTSSLPDSFRYLGALISGTFKRTYYATTSKNIQHNFTTALRATNSALAQEAKSGTGQWVGILQSVVMASDGNSLLIATTGGYLAYLKRKGHVIDIPLEQGEGTRPFGSFTTGSLKAQDSLLVGPRKALMEQETETALVEDSSRLLKRLHKMGIACIRVGISQDALPQAYSAIGRIGDIAYSTREFMRTTRKGIRQLVIQIGNILVHVPKLIRALNPKMRFKSALSKFKNFSSQKLKSGKSVTQGATTRIVRDGVKGATTRIVHGIKASRTNVQKLHMPSAPKLPSSSVARLGSPRVLGIIAALILGVGVGTVFLFRTQNQQTNIYAAEAFAAARAALERGETKIILGDESSAIEAFTEGLSVIKDTEGIEDIEGTDALKQELTNRRNSLSGIVSADVSVRLSFAGFPVALNSERIEVVSLEESTAIALGGPTHPAIWLNGDITLIDGTFYILPQEFVSGVLDIASSKDTSSFSVVTTEGMTIIDANNRNALAQVTFGYNDEKAVFVAQNETTTFTLSGEGTLRAFSYDSENEEDILSELSWPIYKDDRLLETRDFLAIESEPYALLNNNTFLRLRRNIRAARYTIEGFNWDGEARAFDAFDDGRLAILDTKYSRILITKQNGDIITQYEIVDANDALDIAIMPQQRSILILTRDTVMELHLPELPPKTIS